MPWRTCRTRCRQFDDWTVVYVVWRVCSFRTRVLVGNIVKFRFPSLQRLRTVAITAKHIGHIILASAATEGWATVVTVAGEVVVAVASMSLYFTTTKQTHHHSCNKLLIKIIISSYIFPSINNSIINIIIIIIILFFYLGKQQ